MTLPAPAPMAAKGRKPRRTALAQSPTGRNRYRLTVEEGDALRADLTRLTDACGVLGTHCATYRKWQPVIAGVSLLVGLVCGGAWL